MRLVYIQGNTSPFLSLALSQLAGLLSDPTFTGFPQCLSSMRNKWTYVPADCESKGSVKLCGAEFILYIHISSLSSSWHADEKFSLFTNVFFTFAASPFSDYRMRNESKLECSAAIDQLCIVLNSFCCQLSCHSLYGF